jgi:hypothetical protein
MSYFFRSIWLFLLAFFFLNQWYILAGLAFFGYLFRYAGYEIVALALLIDGYYGAFLEIPLLSLTVFCIWFATILLRERLLLYTQQNETLS